MREELGVGVLEFEYLDAFDYSDGSISEVFIITRWQGEPEALEARRLVWVENESQLTNELDRDMLRVAQKLALPD